MEKMLPGNNQDKSKILELEGVLKSESKDITLVESKNSELSPKKEINCELNGQIITNSGSVDGSENTTGSKSSQQKTYSPTLIESAFKAVKNLFSPDKTKSKSTLILSSGKEHQSASESPTSSICITTKTEPLTSDLGSENSLNFQAGENNVKNQLNMNQVLLSPLTVESHNNTDESFLTTVSIIDDSFHSAITNLDENGESVKLDANVMNNFLNSSQNLEIGDPCNETLENSEYCLENTTLRNGSFASENTKLGSISDLSKDDGNGECWSTSQLNGICNGTFSDDSEKVTVVETQPEAAEENLCGAITPRKHNSVNVELSNKSHSKEETVCLEKPEEDPIKTNLQPEKNRKLNDSTKNTEMKDLFVNESFDAPLKIPTSEKLMGENNFERGSVVCEEEEKKLRLDCCNDQRVEENKMRSENPKNERDVCVENCISTTTIVLSSVDSVDLDRMLTSLRENLSATNTSSSQIFSVGSIESAAFSSEELLEKQSKEDGCLQNELVSNNTLVTETNVTVHKPQKNKSSACEKDCSNNASHPNKIKLHKSDEFLNHRISNESPERAGRKKKSSLDVSLIKNSEACRKIDDADDDIEFKIDLESAELNVQDMEFLKNENINKFNIDGSSDEPVTSSVISQQSYTVLTTHDKSLNRPVIDSVAGDDKDSFGKLAFQATDSDKCLVATTISETSASVSYCNSSLGAPDPATPTQQKQSTPLWKGNNRNSPNENCQALVKPASLNLDSPTEYLCEEKRELKLSTSSKCNSEKKSIQLFSLNEDPAEFSPVNPISENELLFSNSTENEIGGSETVTMSNLNCTKVLSKGSSEPKQTLSRAAGFKAKKLQEELTGTSEAVTNLNQTFDTKVGSPQPHVMNQTFKKKIKSPGFLEDAADCEEPNVNLDKTTDPSSGDKTFTKRKKSLEIEVTNQTYDVSASPEGNELNNSFNKNFISRGLNQTFDKSSSIGPQKLNETFDKKSQLTSLSTTEKTINAKMEAPATKITGQNSVKEKNAESVQRKKGQEMNKTFEVKEVPDYCKNLVVETRGIEQTNAGDGPTEKSALGLDHQVPEHFESCHKDLNGSFISGKGSNTSLVESEFSTLLLNEGSLTRHQSLDDLAGKLGKLNLNDSSGAGSVPNGPSSARSAMLPENSPALGTPTEELTVFSDSISSADDKLRCDPYLFQLIQEQFSSNDILKICSVVDDFSSDFASMKLNAQILKASEQFDKSFHENLSNADLQPLELEAKPSKAADPLSPQSFDFLSSIQGKPTGRDWSRESLYVKFDPLVQPNPNSLIDFTKEGEALSAAEKSPAVAQGSSVCEQLLTISPQKKSEDIVPPLTPLSHRTKANQSEDKVERIKELQNEIYFLKNLYAERERANKAKMEDCESQVTKLTGENCFLENKLKESNEREKALVKKIKEQNQSLAQLKIIMEEYVKVISTLTAELEALKTENQKQIESLSTEKDSYMTHLQNTEAAFTDVHTKYEKSKKTIVSLKSNEVMYRNTIAEQAQKLEDLKAKAREAQEKTFEEIRKIEEELSETKANHSQETARLRAQLRKTELKVEALQESLEQKMKENQQLTAICDELIEGKK